MLLLDTNVLSEILKPRPDAMVGAFLDRVPAAAAFTSTICEAEIRYGVAKLPMGVRREQLSSRIDAILADAFRGRVLPFDGECAKAFGVIRARREACGRPISPPDAMIAATASVHGATLVTRNTRDFTDCGIEFANPWLTRP